MREMLGSPCRINKLALRNRLVFEAVGNGLSELNGDVSQKEIAFYTERAKGGVGLIMTEAVPMDSVTRRAKPRDLCIDRGDQIAGYQALADAVHAYDTKSFVELYHPGRQGSSQLNGGREMFAPSAIECSAVHEPVMEMTAADIQYMVRKYVDGAIRRQKAGMTVC